MGLLWTGPRNPFALQNESMVEAMVCWYSKGCRTIPGFLNGAAEWTSPIHPQQVTFQSVAFHVFSKWARCSMQFCVGLKFAYKGEPGFNHGERSGVEGGYMLNTYGIHFARSWEFESATLVCLILGDPQHGGNPHHGCHKIQKRAPARKNTHTQPKLTTARRTQPAPPPPPPASRATPPLNHPAPLCPAAAAPRTPRWPTAARRAGRPRPAGRRGPQARRGPGQASVISVAFCSLAKSFELFMG